jgi:2'-5' RNA ligase
MEQPFLPHITMALGLSESEARSVVREMRAEPVDAEFRVDSVWLVVQEVGDGARVERQQIPLGGVELVALRQD